MGVQTSNHQPIASPQLFSDRALPTKLLIIWRDRQNFQHLIGPLRTMLAVTVCFVCAWLPYAAMAIIGPFVSFQDVGPYVTEVAGLLAKSYVALDPIVYVLTDEAFRQQMFRIVYRK
jgi:hypothetical protein